MHRSRTTSAAVLAGVIALYAGTAAQQAPAVQSLRRVLSDLALPGIDSGLVDDGEIQGGLFLAKTRETSNNILSTLGCLCRIANCNAIPCVGRSC